MNKKLYYAVAALASPIPAFLAWAISAALFDLALGRSDGNVEGMEAPFLALLLSPVFLFLSFYAYVIAYRKWENNSVALQSLCICSSIAVFGVSLFLMVLLFG